MAYRIRHHHRYGWVLWYRSACTKVWHILMLGAQASEILAFCDQF